MESLTRELSDSWQRERQLSELLSSYTADIKGHLGGSGTAHEGKSELEHKLQAKEEAVVKLTQLNDQLLQRVTALASSNKELKDQNDSLKTRMLKLQHAVQQLHQQCKERHSTPTPTPRENGRLTPSRHRSRSRDGRTAVEWKKREEALLGRVKEAESIAAEERRAKIAAEERIAQHHKEIRGILKRMRSAEQAVEEYEGETKKMTTEIASLTSRLNALRQRNDSLEAKVAARKEEKSVQAELVAEIERLQKMVRLRHGAL